MNKLFEKYDLLLTNAIGPAYALIVILLYPAGVKYNQAMALNRFLGKLDIQRATEANRFTLLYRTNFTKLQLKTDKLQSPGKLHLPHCTHTRPTVYPHLPHCVHIQPTVYPHLPHCVHIQPTVYPHLSHCVHTQPTVWTSHNWPHKGTTLLCVGQPTHTFGLPHSGSIAWGPHDACISRWYWGPQ